MTIIYILLILWLIWVLGHVILMASIRPSVPHFNGFSVHIPDWVNSKLTKEETRAIWFHEKGHQLHRHVWKNLVLVATFRRPTIERRLDQELEADDHAARMGYGIEMASALRKLSLSAHDNVRARRLEMLEVGRQYERLEGFEQPTSHGRCDDSIGEAR